MNDEFIFSQPIDLPDMTIASAPGIFKQKYDRLEGSDWLKTIEPEDRKVFSRLGLAANDYGRYGGSVRASTAKRDRRGRFVKSS